MPNQNNRKTVVTFVTEDGYEITTDNFMMKKILREKTKTYSLEQEKTEKAKNKTDKDMEK